MIEAPKIYSMWDEEGKAMGKLCSRGVTSDGQGKSLTTFSTPTLHKQQDGTVIERGVDGRGSWIYRHWSCWKDAIEYREESWGNVKHERW